MVKGGRGGQAPLPLLPPTGSVIEDRDLQSNPNKRVADLGPPAVRLGKGRGRGRGGSSGPSRGGSVPRGIAPPAMRAEASQRGSGTGGRAARGSRGVGNASFGRGSVRPSGSRADPSSPPGRQTDDRGGRGWVTDHWRPSSARENWRDVPFRPSYHDGPSNRYYERDRDARYYDDRYERHDRHDDRRYDDHRRYDEYGTYSPGVGPSDYRDRPSRPAREAYVDESYDALALSPTRRHRRFSDCDDDGSVRSSPAKVPRLSDYDRTSPRKPPEESYSPFDESHRKVSHAKPEQPGAKAPDARPSTPSVPPQRDEPGKAAPSPAPSKSKNTAVKPPTPRLPDPSSKEEGVRPPAPVRASTPPPVTKLKFKPTKPKPKQPTVPAATISGGTAPSTAADSGPPTRPVPVIRSDVKEEGMTAHQSGPATTTAPLKEQTGAGGIRLEGVISYKRHEVLPSCFSINKEAKAAAREALVADVAQKLKNEERMITKVWWRDDGVGFDWVSTAPTPQAAQQGSSSGSVAKPPRATASAGAPAPAATTAKPSAASIAAPAADSTPSKARPRAASKTGTLSTKTFTFPPGVPENSRERLHFIERRTLEASQLDSQFRPTVKVEASATTSCLTLTVTPLTPADRPVLPFDRQWLLEFKGSTAARLFPTDNPIKDEIGPQGKKWKSHCTDGQRTNMVPIPRLYEATAEEDLTLAEYLDFCRTEVRAAQKYKKGEPTRQVVCCREGRFLSIASRPLHAKRTPLTKEERAREAAPATISSDPPTASTSASKDKTETKRARKLEETTQEGDRPQVAKKAKGMPEMATAHSIATPITGTDPSLAPLPQSPPRMPKIEPVSPVKRTVEPRVTSPSPSSAPVARPVPASAPAPAAAVVSPSSAPRYDVQTKRTVSTAAPTASAPAAASAPPAQPSDQVLSTQPPTPQSTPGPEVRPDQKRPTPAEEKSSIVAGLEGQLAAKLAKITQWTELMDKYPDQRSHFQKQVDRMEHDIFDIHQQIEQAKAAAIA